VAQRHVWLHYISNFPQKLNMNFEAERWIVGAQAVGEVGVARRIDVIATAMMDGATVFDLEDLELCCAATCPWRIGVNWRKPRPY
jgi:hypothetical protein